MFKTCTTSVLLTSLLTTMAYANPADFFSIDAWQANLQKGQKVVQIGAFSAKQGISQHVGIQNLIGDEYSVKHKYDQGLLIGFGYFSPNSREYANFNLSYGLNAFYLSQARVKGTIMQENLFTNLAYKYNIANLPIYAVAKAVVKNNDSRYNFTADIGLGPNIIQTSQYQETSLDNITIPSHRFTSTTSLALSGMLGVGVKLNNVLEQAPVECGYKLFYLGQGKLDTHNNQVLNKLKTGNSFAHSIVCGVFF